MQAQVEYQQQYPAEVIDMGVAAMTAEQIEALQVPEAKPEVIITEKQIGEMVGPKSPEPANVASIDAKGKPVIDDKPGVESNAASLEAKAPAAEAEKKVNPAWAADGVNLATVFKSADLTRKQQVLKLCPLYVGNVDAQTDVLKAFRSALGDTSAAAQTSSKIKKIFEAYGVPKHGRPVIDLKTKTAVIKDGVVVMDIRSGKEWLEAHTEGWEHFYKTASEIAGKQKRPEPSGKKEKTNLSDVETAEMVSDVKVANLAQAEQIVNAGLEQVIKSLPEAKPGVTGMTREQMCVNMIYKHLGVLKDADDLGYQSLAEDILGRLNDFEAQRAAEDAAFKAKNGIK